MKKVLSILLSLVMLISVTAGLSFTAQAATAINSVTVTGVDKPLPGFALDNDVSVSGSGYNLATDIAPRVVSWYDLDVSATKSIASDSKYVNGHRYMVAVTLIADGTHEFSNSVSAKINIGGVEYNADKMAYSTYSTSNVIVVTASLKCEYNKITTVTLTSDPFEKGAELTKDFFYAQGTGIDSYFAPSFTRNGETISVGEKVTFGDYGASIVLSPKAGYAFDNNVNIKLGNQNNAFKITDTIGLVIIAKSADDLWHLDCTHNYGDWEYDATSHWKACSECGFKTYLDTHDFSESTVDGNTVYTCNDCGYVKTAKNVVDNFLYADVTGGVEIIQYKGSAANVSVPSTLAGKTVVSIGNYAFASSPNKAAITSITLPSTVKTIGRSAFNGCAALTSVNIPSGVKRIETETFLGCSALASVTIPYGVNYIGDSAFYGTAISSIVIPCSVKEIGSSAFRSCENLSGVVVPDSVTSLGDAFMACSALKSVVIGNGVTTIAQSTFDACTALESIVLPAGLTSVGKYNFDNKSSFSNIYFRGTSSQWSSVTIASGNTNSATVSYDYAEKFDVGQHKYIVAQTVAPTCVDEGYTLNMCEGCGDAFKTDIKSATGVHTYNSGEITTEPTCVAKGEKTYLCTVCAAVKTEEVAATGVHTYDEENATIVHPTCTVAGSITYTCTVCGQTISKSVKATGHMYMDKVTKQPTFKKTGIKTYTCVEGDDSYTETIPKLKNTKVKKVKAAKKKITVTLLKRTDVDGYQIQYSTSKKFKKAKTVKIKKAATVKKVIKKLKSGKKYYIRVRAYKKINGKVQYAKWAKYKKAVKVK